VQNFFSQGTFLAASPLLGQFYQNLITVNTYFMLPRGLRGWHAERFSCANIKACAVAGTNNGTAIQSAFSEGSPIVRIDIVQTIHLSVHVKKDDKLLIAFDNLFTGIGDLR